MSGGEDRAGGYTAGGATLILASAWARGQRWSSRRVPSTPSGATGGASGTRRPTTARLSLARYLVVGLAVVLLLAAQLVSAGNPITSAHAAPRLLAGGASGTVKIQAADGLDVAEVNNEPHAACSFVVHGFTMAASSGTLTIQGWLPTDPSRTVVLTDSYGATAPHTMSFTTEGVASGQTSSFVNGPYTLPAGHYKLSVTDATGNELAKYKVFWVDPCPTPTPTATDTAVPATVTPLAATPTATVSTPTDVPATATSTATSSPTPDATVTATSAATSDPATPTATSPAPSATQAATPTATSIGSPPPSATSATTRGAAPAPTATSTGTGQTSTAGSTPAAKSTATTTSDLPATPVAVTSGAPSPRTGTSAAARQPAPSTPAPTTDPGVAPRHDRVPARGASGGTTASVPPARTASRARTPGLVSPAPVHGSHHRSTTHAAGATVQTTTPGATLTRGGLRAGTAGGAASTRALHSLTMPRGTRTTRALHPLTTRGGTLPTRPRSLPLLPQLPNTGAGGAKDDTLPWAWLVLGVALLGWVAAAAGRRAARARA